MEEPFDVTWASRTTHHVVNQFEFTKKIIGEILAWRPDAIWTAHVNMSGLALMLARAINARTILNTYGLEVWSGLSISRRMGLQYSNEVISDCHFTAKYLEENGYRRKASVTVIWDAVDVLRFYPSSPAALVVRKYRIPPPETSINLLTLGRLTRGAEHKGYRRLLDAFAIAAKAIDSLHLIYAGDGDLVAQLRERAEALGLSSRVHFTGSIHDKDLPDVYRAAHIFSLISDRGKGRGEGVPVTPLEAAACGMPILVGNQDGSPEAVMEGATGCILDSFDIHAHANAIVYLANDPALRKSLGTAASEWIKTEFSYQTFREKHRAFLSSTSS